MDVSAFFQQLKEARPEEGEGRRWLYVPYDQLSDQIGPLSREQPSELGIILIENPHKASRRPYHKQKLAYVLANMRHFALEQARRGVAVRYRVADESYLKTLRKEVQSLGALEMMEAAERELRQELQPLVDEHKLTVLAHEGWLTSREQFRKSQKKGDYRMDAFYRRIRKETGILMEDGSPLGGKYSHDAANREFWPGEPAAPDPPTFELDAVKAEVGELLEKHFAHHPGKLDLERLSATASQAQALWNWAKQECMEHFGPFEDAMSFKSRGIFHTRISPLLNLHRLLPSQVVDEVLELEIPLSSMEGFVRQVIGWREFVRHVHRETEGFQNLHHQPEPVRDGGYQKWSGRAWPGHPPEDGPAPNFLASVNPVPPAFWGSPSGLACLDQVVEDVWEEGYTHHITRLMVLSNLATLLDLSPRQITDWFWVAYIDAYDWVVEPNVLAMGTYAVGPLMTTKPYVSGGAYINKMSDYCEKCAFNPKKNCPITRLYWAFLARHKEQLEDNVRLRLPLSSLGKRSAQKKEGDSATYNWMVQSLERGQILRPENAPRG